ncbi:MAG: hypothetical protein ABSF15_06985 [Candidatus Sulfotelmatobacter sp.]|jgi:hypothetical protein
MRKCLFLLLSVGMVFILTVGLSAGNLETKGKAWLGAHSEAAAINVNGVWHAKAWGKIVLDQAQGGRDLTGKGDGWDVSGVVSGKQVFLLFSHHGGVAYSAELTSEGESNLNGSYSRGFMSDKTKGKSMRLTKQ